MAHIVELISQRGLRLARLLAWVDHQFLQHGKVLAPQQPALKKEIG